LADAINKTSQQAVKEPSFFRNTLSIIQNVHTNMCIVCENNWINTIKVIQIEI